jgi:tetratricopeptide (TPR) repeat protein
MSRLCKRPKCALLGTAHCSACQNEWYCSVECQRENWKDHKITCGKRLLTESELITFLDDTYKVARNFDQTDRNERNINLLKNAILIAEYQFGDWVQGKCFRQLKNGVVFENDLPLFRIREILTEHYVNEGTATSFDIALGYALETRTQLEMRCTNDEDRDVFLERICQVNTQLGDIYMKTIQYEESLHHYEEALAAARHCSHENDRKLLILVPALQSMANILNLMVTKEGAKYAEEAYLIVSGEHGPEHPDVQGAANYLIDSYLRMNNFVDAERFARINYECLIDPIHRINYRRLLFVVGKLQLARTWLLTPPEQRIGGPEAAEEAETLAREACGLLEKIEMCEESEDPTATNILTSHHTLVQVMIANGKKGSEVERSILHALSFTEECRGREVLFLDSYCNRFELLALLGYHYYSSAGEVVARKLDIGLLEKAKEVYKEAVTIATAVFSPDSHDLLKCVAKVREIEEILTMYAHM